MNLLYMWDDAILFIGRLPKLPEHKAALGSYSWGFDTELIFTSEENTTQSCQSVYLPPMYKHGFAEIDSLIAVLYVQTASPSPEVRTNCYLETLPVIKEIYESQPDAPSCRSLLVDVLKTVDLSNLDPRILQTVATIVKDPAGTQSLEELAQAVQLSATRLQHLFKTELKSSVRMFRTFARLRKAVECIERGESLTEAALNAGFYDSAHFSNKFREASGLSPSMLFGAGVKTKLTIAKPVIV